MKPRIVFYVANIIIIMPRRRNKHSATIEGLESKFCRKCKKWWATGWFNKCSVTWDKLQNYCKVCNARYMKEYHWRMK
jgi:hypothetical protein